jgi:hypothetical protein
MVTQPIAADIKAGNDKEIAPISSGTSFKASKAQTGTNYYFASPAGASTSFAVTLSGDV